MMRGSVVCMRWCGGWQLVSVCSFFLPNCCASRTILRAGSSVCLGPSTGGRKEGAGLGGGVMAVSTREIITGLDRHWW